MITFSKYTVKVIHLNRNIYVSILYRSIGPDTGLQQDILLHATFHILREINTLHLGEYSTSCRTDQLVTVCVSCVIQTYLSQCSVEIVKNKAHKYWIAYGTSWCMRLHLPVRISMNTHSSERVVVCDVAVASALYLNILVYRIVCYGCSSYVLFE